MRALGRPGHWTAAEALATLRRAAESDVEAKASNHVERVRAWVRRDLDGPDGILPSIDAESLYRVLALTGRGESIFRSGLGALATSGYGRLADGLDPWVANRYVGIGCPWWHARPAEGETVVDVGSGAGVDVHVAQEWVGNSGLALGVDLRPHLLERVARTHGNRAQFVRGAAEALPLAAGSIDRLTANGLPTVMRQPTLGSALVQFARVLRPGGWLQMAVLAAGSDQTIEEIDDLLVVNAIRCGKPLCPEYRSRMTGAGFSSVTLQPLPSPFIDGFRPGPIAAYLVTGCRS